MSTAYDDLPYPSLAFPQTHPDRLSTHAKLFGLPYAPLDNCRFLDIGGGEGSNVIPMALTLPNSEFVSFDLSETAVARGQAVVEALGLKNVRVMFGDITTIDFGEERFDYIVAHGIYSWVPDQVREAMMGLFPRFLTPEGIGYVSYNVFPGCRLRQMIRDMLLWELRDVQGASKRYAEAQRYLKYVIDDFSHAEPLAVAFKVEIQKLLDRHVVGHDELSETYHPVHLHEFQAHALRHGMKFLTEAEPRRVAEGFAPPSETDNRDYDPVPRAQDFDFRTLTAFRQSIIVRGDTPVDRRPRPELLLDMHVSSAATRNEDGKFTVSVTEFEVEDEVLTQALLRMAEAWPATIPVLELVTDPVRLNTLMRMYWMGTVDLHANPSRISTTISDRPAASPLARRQARTGAARMVTLQHETLDVPDDFSRDFIAGLDGSRDLEELARDVAKTMGRPVDDDLRRQLKTNLEALARMPLLIA